MQHRRRRALDVLDIMHHQDMALHEPPAPSQRPTIFVLVEGLPTPRSARGGARAPPPSYAHQHSWTPPDMDAVSAAQRVAAVAAVEEEMQHRRHLDGISHVLRQFLAERQSAAVGIAEVTGTGVAPVVASEGNSDREAPWASAAVQTRTGDPAPATAPATAFNVGFAEDADGPNITVATPPPIDVDEDEDEFREAERELYHVLFNNSDEDEDHIDRGEQ